jgi:hypothetical protein
MSADRSETDLQRQIADLEGRLQEVETVQQVILRILSTTKPLNSVLEQYGATESQEQAFYKLLDELVARTRGREQDRPTFAYFQMRLAEIFPSQRGDQQFTTLLVDTMKLERPAYRELHAFAVAQGWPRGI